MFLGKLHWKGRSKEWWRVINLGCLENPICLRIFAHISMPRDVRKTFENIRLTNLHSSLLLELTLKLFPFPGNVSWEHFLNLEIQLCFIVTCFFLVELPILQSWPTWQGKLHLQAFKLQDPNIYSYKEKLEDGREGEGWKAILLRDWKS